MKNLCYFKTNKNVDLEKKQKSKQHQIKTIIYKITKKKEKEEMKIDKTRNKFMVVLQMVTLVIFFCLQLSFTNTIKNVQLQEGNVIPQKYTELFAISIYLTYPMIIFSIVSTALRNKILLIISVVTNFVVYFQFKFYSIFGKVFLDAFEKLTEDEPGLKEIEESSKCCGWKVRRADNCGSELDLDTCYEVMGEKVQSYVNDFYSYAKFLSKLMLFVIAVSIAFLILYKFNKGKSKAEKELKKKKEKEMAEKLLEEERLEKERQEEEEEELRRKERSKGKKGKKVKKN